MFELAAELERVAAGRQLELIVQSLLGLGDEAADVATANVGRDGDPALAPFARDFGRAFDDANVGEARERQTFAIGRGNQGSNRCRPRRAHAFRQANHERKTQLAFDHFAERLAADRFDDVGDDFGRHAIAGQLLLVELDLEDRLAGDLLAGDVGVAGNLLENCFDLFGFGGQHVEVVAIELDRHVGTNAGDHFVHPHFDRLQKLQALARQVAEVIVDLLGEFGLCGRLRPLVARLERDEHVGQFDAHRIGRDFGGADAAPNVLDLVGEFGENRPSPFACCT